MSPERWSLVKECFGAAVELPSEQRSSFVRRRCGADDELLRDVESLLAAHTARDRCLLDERLSAMIEQPGMRQQRIGPYRVEKEIGHGGMGSVYLALRADAEYENRVAIKIIHGGGLSDLAKRRFRNERQILAALNHANIARLLDGGTTSDGVPYLVMEYIEGEPIDRYCRSRALSLTEKLTLFRTLCSAVQYAHRNLVVHRDLKPANILVDADGQPKLLDFGIAKLIEDEAACEPKTATGLRMLTPAYASPEQVRGERASTATDVYSLGVVLYELVTGVHPLGIDSSTGADGLRAILEKEPRRASAALMRSSSAPDVKLARALRGDLDTIMLKALAKDPHARYASVEQFADDIGRYLDGTPVLARKPTARYRAVKFVRRNTAATAATLLVAMTLVGSTMVAVRQASIASAARVRAEEHARAADARLRDVRELANALLIETHDALERLPGSLEARERIIKRSVEYLDRVASQASRDPDVLKDVAHAYERLGAVTYGVAAAEPSRRKAVGMAEALVRQNPSNAEYQYQLVTSLGWYGDVLKLQGDYAGELRAYKRARDVAEGLVMLRGQRARHQPLLKEVYDDLAEAQARQGEYAAALENHRRAIVIARGLAASSPSDPAARRGLVRSLHRAAETLAASGAADQALEHYAAARPMVEALAAADPLDSRYKRDVWLNRRGAGSILSQQGHHTSALAQLGDALALKKALLRADPTDGGHRRGMAMTHLWYAEALERSGDAPAAVAHYRTALALGEPLLSDDPSNQETYDDVALQYQRLASVLRKLRRSGEAQALALRQQRLYRSIATSHPRNAKARAALAALAR